MRKNKKCQAETGVKCSNQKARCVRATDNESVMVLRHDIDSSLLRTPPLEHTKNSCFHSLQPSTSVARRHYRNR